MVSQDFPPQTGGIQTYAWELARTLSAHCDALHVVCPGAPSADDAQLPCSVHRVTSSSDAFPLRAVPTMMRLLLQERIDVLFHVQWQTAPMGALLRGLARVPTLAIAIHGKELLLRPLAHVPVAQRAYDALRTSVLQQADVLLPVSQFSAALARDCTRTHAAIEVVPNGVHAQRFAGEHSDAESFRARHHLGRSNVLLTVGRLVPRKGIDDVIASLPALIARVPDLHYVVVGSGPDRERLESLTFLHDVRDRVHFLGRIAAAELTSAYAACDVFVLAARDERDSVEGFGLVLLEASASGKPTVATNAGGMGDAVQHEVTGLVVPAGDRTALTQALFELLSTSEKAARLGAAGRTRALTEGSWQRTAQRIASALNRARAAREVPTAFASES